MCDFHSSSARLCPKETKLERRAFTRQLFMLWSHNVVEARYERCVTCLEKEGKSRPIPGPALAAPLSNLVSLLCSKPPNRTFHKFRASLSHFYAILKRRSSDFENFQLSSRASLHFFCRTEELFEFDRLGGRGENQLRRIGGLTTNPTENLAISELQNLSIKKIYVAKVSQSSEYEAGKLWAVPSGSWGCQVARVLLELKKKPACLNLD